MLGPLDEGPDSVLVAVEEGTDRSVLLVTRADRSLVGQAERVEGFVVSSDVAALPVGPCMVIGHPHGRPLAELGGEDRVAAVARLAGILAAGARAGLGVPELGAGQVFVQASGEVAVVGVRRSESSIDDVVALLDGETELGLRLQEAVDRGELTGLEELVVELGAAVPTPAEAAQLGTSDVVWTEAAEPRADAGMPPKARVALAAALTLALGFASAWFVIPMGSEVVELRAPGASSLAVSCADVRYETSAERILLPPSPTPCEIRATLGEREVSGEVTRARVGAYDCRDDEGELRCVRR